MCSLPNSRWLRNMLDYEKEGAKCWSIRSDLTMCEQILEQSVRVVEGEPIYLTEEQWDRLHDYILDMRQDPFSGPNCLRSILGVEKYEALTEEEQVKAVIEWGSSLDEYTDLFKRDIY